MSTPWNDTGFDAYEWVIELSHNRETVWRPVKESWFEYTEENLRRDMEPRPLTACMQKVQDHFTATYHSAYHCRIINIHTDAILPTEFLS